MVRFNHQEIHWDQVPKDLKADSMEDLTPEQKSKALEWARDHAERLPEMGGVEFWMAQYFSHTIGDVQRHQFASQPLSNMPYHAVVYPDGVIQARTDYEQAMAEIESWRDWQDAQEQLRAMQEAMVEFATKMGTTFAAAAKSLHDAMMTAAPAIQTLLDHLGAQPSEPLRNRVQRPTCPSHGRPMKGGRCTMCDRRR